MTKFEYVAQALESTLGLILVIKLLLSRLHATYKLFSLYVVCQVVASLLWMLQRFFDAPGEWFDYRLAWVAEQAVLGILIILTVYTLLDTVLSSLPGILKMSRRYLNYTFVAAGAIGVMVLARESAKAGYLRQLTWQDDLIFVGIMADRVVSIMVLLSILAILGFLLWFPMQVARNLAVFVVGFSVYAMGSSFSLLFQASLLHDASRWISTSIQLLTSACYAYWILCIWPAGEAVPTRLNVRRDRDDEKRLILALELLNDSVLKSAKR